MAAPWRRASRPGRFAARICGMSASATSQPVAIDCNSDAGGERAAHAGVGGVFHSRQPSLPEPRVRCAGADYGDERCRWPAARGGRRQWLTVRHRQNVASSLLSGPETAQRRRRRADGTQIHRNVSVSRLRHYFIDCLRRIKSADVGRRSASVARCAGLGGAGLRLWLVSVARTWGTCARWPVGSWAVLAGVAASRFGVRRLHRRRSGGAHACRRSVACYATADEAHRSAGGTLELVVEPNPPLSMLRELQQRLQAGVSACCAASIWSTAHRLPWHGRATNRVAGATIPRRVWTALAAADHRRRPDRALSGADGDGQSASDVTVCDPRFEAEAAWMSLAPMVRDMLDDFLLHWQPDAHSAVVSPHDPKIDDPLFGGAQVQRHSSSAPSARWRIRPNGASVTWRA